MHKAIYKFFHHHYHSRYHGKYRQAEKLFVFDLVLLFCSIILLGASLFFFFWKPTITDLIDIEFSFGANERLLSGHEMTLTVGYKNRSKHYLDAVVLALHLPKGFIIDRSKTPESVFSNENTQVIGKIAPGASGKVEISGIIFAEPNVEEKISAFLSYRPENKNNKEQKISAAFFKTVGSTLLPEIRISSTTLPGHEMPITLALKNTGQTTLTNFSLKSEAKYNFTKNEELQNITLSPGETKAFAGSLTAPNETGSHSLRFNFDILVNNETIRFQTLEKEINVISPTISTGLKSVFTNSFADANDTVPVRLYWNNSGQYTLKNVRLRISTTPGVVDLRATAAQNRLKLENGELIADKTTRSSLSSSAPGSSDEFVINLKLLSFFRTDDHGQLEIQIVSEAELPEMPDQKFSQTSSEIVRLPLATQIGWKIRPVYYTEGGDQLGRGPLPPIIGDTTKYWIFIEIENGVNAIVNNNFSAILGDGVEFTGKQSVSVGSEMTYNKSSNIMSWDHGYAADLSNIGLYFEVAVKPTMAQLGKKIVLVKSINFTADDDITGKKLQLIRGELDNSLSDEDQGSAAKPEVSQ